MNFKYIKTSLSFSLVVIFGMSSHAMAGFYPSYSSIPYQNKISSIPSGEIKIYVGQTQQALKTINRDFYGAQISPFNPPPPESQTQNLQLGIIKNAGNLHDRYNWETDMFSLPGGLFAKGEPLEQMIPEFKNLGARPVIQINLLGWRPELDQGNLVIRKTADASSAKKMIQHYNGDLRLGITDVSLGNEFAQWNETHSDLWDLPGPMDADEYIDRFIQFAIAIREGQEQATGNPYDVKIWGPETSISYYDWQTANMQKDCEWTDIEGQMKCSYGNGQFDNFIPYFFYRLAQAEKDQNINPKQYRLLDFFSFHYYPNFRTNINDINSIIQLKEGVQDIPGMLTATQLLHSPNYINQNDISAYKKVAPNILGRMQQWKNQYYPKAQMSLSEFAVDSFDNSFGYHPIVRPLYLADLIGFLPYNGIDSFIQSFLHTTTDNPMPWVLLNGTDTTELYVIYQLFTNNYLGQLLMTQDSYNDWLNSYATLYKKNAQSQEIHFFVVNKSSLSKKSSIKLVRGNQEQVIAQYEFPAWSVTFMKIPSQLNNQSIISIQQFGANEMGVKIDDIYKTSESSNR